MNKAKYIDVSWSHIRFSEALMNDLGLRKVKVSVSKKGLLFTKDTKEEADRIFVRPNKSGAYENINPIAELYDLFDWLDWDTNKFYQYDATEKGVFFKIIQSEESKRKQAELELEIAKENRVIEEPEESEEE